MSDEKNDIDILPASLSWMADAPLFIDEDLIDRFYDAVVKPASAEGPSTVTMTEESIAKIRGKLGLSGEAKSTKFLELLTGGLFGFGVKGSAEIGLEGDERKAESNTVTFHPISTPQRQLEQLVLHYLLVLPDRIFLEEETRGEDSTWRSRESITEVPRSIVFIDLPGSEDAVKSERPESRIIPTAAEFSNGDIVPIYGNLKFGRWVPPKYPETPRDIDVSEYSESGLSEWEMLENERKKYWKEFASKEFNSQVTMMEVENAAMGRGRIEWIDYRVPLTSEGESLHLHLHPRGRYPTGDFAYNFIKRGHKHGLRIIGALKSEPDLNVMAVYEK